MQYHTALALAAERPVSLEIGRAAFVGRPVSVPVILRALALIAEAQRASTVQHANAGVLEAEHLVLRAAFPAPPRWKWWQDPLRTIATIDGNNRARLLRRLMTVPDGMAAPAPEEDYYAELRRQQKALSSPSTPVTGHRPTLSLAALTCRATFGELWYYNPDRWPTSDGYVPHAVCWVEYHGLAALEARAQLTTISAHAVLKSGKGARREIDKLMAHAFPGDPLLAPLSRPVS